MQQPPQIAFRRMDTSPAVEARTPDEIASPERFFERINHAEEAEFR